MFVNIVSKIYKYLYTYFLASFLYFKRDQTKYSLKFKCFESVILIVKNILLLYIRMKI